jgi:hypothetical protein
MQTNKKVLFLIPDGVGVRNYLYSNVITQLKHNATITFWSTLPIEVFDEVKKLHNIDFNFKKINLTPEHFLTRLYREAATYSRLNYNAKLVQNPTILVNWRTQGKNFKLKALYKAAEFIGKRTVSKYNKIIQLEEKSKKNWDINIIAHYKQELLKENPDSIFITHQRVAGLMPICLAAKELGIQVVSAIYSWDNMPKARLAIEADKYVVWSNYMKDEFKLYHPEVPHNNVMVTGTPQFEFYQQESRIINKATFAEKYNLDLNKIWICYSGDDKLTSPNDPIYLEDIAKAIENSHLKGKVQIIFRRSPADISDRFDEVIAKYKKIIISINPDWNSKQTGWAGFFPKLNDIDLLVNIVHYCELVINLGSTMAHDFAVYNKPCLYVNYDIPSTQNWSVKTIYKYQHFRTMDGMDAVIWLHSRDEIAAKLFQALQNPHSVAKDRRKWLEKVVKFPLEASSENIARALLSN